MLPDRVSTSGPLTYESGVLPIALRGPAQSSSNFVRMLILIIARPQIKIGHVESKTRSIGQI